MITEYFKRQFRYYKFGKEYLNNSFVKLYTSIANIEKQKVVSRTDVINSIATIINANTYLEIGVRNPDDNFKNIEINNKYSVDPGIEFKLNPVDFKMTSDEFFDQKMADRLCVSSEFKFDIIFIDGLHEADQVQKDIENSLECLTDSGIIFLHDCNPPTEFHARSNYNFHFTPAKGAWNGSTWKAFLKFRKKLYSCCIDTDYGIGILSKMHYPGLSLSKDGLANEFYEYSILEKNRKESLNLLDFHEFKKILINHTNKQNNE